MNDKTLLVFILVGFSLSFLGGIMVSQVKKKETLKPITKKICPAPVTLEDGTLFYAPCTDAPFTQEALETYPAEENLPLCKTTKGDEKGEFGMNTPCSIPLGTICDLHLSDGSEACKDKPAETILCDDITETCNDMATLPKPPWGYVTVATTSHMYKLETYPALYSKKQCIENMKGYSMNADRYHECITNYPELKEKEPVEVAQCPYLSSHVLRTSSPEADVISRIIKECESSLANKPTEKKSNTDEIKALIKEAHLDYCKRANGYTYIHADVCLINDELKYIEIQTGGILSTRQILSMPRQEAITYIRGRIYVEDVPFAADEIKARKEYEVFKSISKKPLEYPLKSENFTLSHEFEQKNGSTTKDRYILESKKVGYTLWETEENWKEIYQLLKSEYE